MKRMLDKKLPLFTICWIVIIGMVLTSSPAFSREIKSSYGGDRTYKRDRDQGRDNSCERDRSRDRDSSRDRDRYRDRDRQHDRDRCNNRCNNTRRNKSRQTRYVHKNDVLPAIIATGIIAGVTFSLLDNDPAPAPQVAAPAAYPVGVGHGVATSSVVVTAALLNVRSGPGLGKPCVGQLYRGATLSVMGSSAGWYYVQASTGVSGWVMARYTSSAGSMVSG